jgi:hypothetical protein
VIASRFGGEAFLFQRCIHTLLINKTAVPEFCLAPGVTVLAKSSAIAYLSPMSLFFPLQKELMRKFLIIQTTCGRLL